MTLGQDTWPLSGIQWTISAGALHAVIVEVGGGLRTFTVGDTPVIDGYAEDEMCPAGAGQILAPWPNRVGNGRYTFNGAQYQLPINEPDKSNAIHGLVRWLRWHVVEHYPDSVTVECALPAQPGYPFPLLLRTVWSMRPDGLTAEHTVTNIGAVSAPFGFGVHPYFRIGDVPLQELRLYIPAATHLMVDERRLPVREESVVDTPEDFTLPRPIGDTILDTAYTNLMRESDRNVHVRLDAPDGRSLDIWADQSFGWLQVFTADTLPPPRRRRSVAVEPMTCPPDALRSGHDLGVLAVGETWRGHWGVTVNFQGP